MAVVKTAKFHSVPLVVIPGNPGIQPFINAVIHLIFCKTQLPFLNQLE